MRKEININSNAFSECVGCVIAIERGLDEIQLALKPGIGKEKINGKNAVARVNCNYLGNTTVITESKIYIDGKLFQGTSYSIDCPVVNRDA